MTNYKFADSTDIHEHSINVVINEVAKDLKISPSLCKALCKVISDYNPYYCVFDPKLYLLLSNSGPFKVFSPHGGESEIVGRSCRWGIFGVSGHYAREHCNITSSFLSVLVEVELNVAIGLRHLRQLLDRYEESHGLEGVILAFRIGKPKYYQGGDTFRNRDFITRVVNSMNYFETHSQHHDVFSESIKDKSKAKPTIRRKLYDTSTMDTISSMVK